MSVPISVEYFPAASEASLDKLLSTHRYFSELGIDFCSVTYGAGGSTQNKTAETVAALHQANQTMVVPHLTSINADKALLTELITGYVQADIRGILALRGDVPYSGEEMNQPYDAVGLVALIRELAGDSLKVFVAAYPDVHPKASSVQSDVQVLKNKFDAGADEAITQYFYNIDAYCRLRDDLSAMGCDKPIRAGLMPIKQVEQLLRFSAQCHAEIPRWLRLRLERYADDADSLAAFGLEVVGELSEKLITAGAPSLHFYAMNRLEPSMTLIRQLAAKS